MNPPSTNDRRMKHLIVVDPDLDAYRVLADLTEADRLRLTLTSAGRNALRLAPSFADAVWLISPQLPDMSGLDLLDMLHALRRDLRAVVIDNEYDRDRELQALRLRAIQYVCKPLHASWLNAWRAPVEARAETPSPWAAPATNAAASSLPSRT